MDKIIVFLEKLIGVRDAHGNHHGQNVNLLASALARRIDFPSSDLANLEYAATIHDIGKITVNEFVVNKAGRLTEAEYIMIQQHTALGHKLLKPLGLPALVMDVILSHHENYDGTGYPNGLAGKHIPLAARIIRIADTYDALTSDRGYRQAYTRKKALDIMSADAKSFDPELLEIFFKMKIYSTAPDSETTRHI
ncbi:MAG: HD domain-containing protein [Chloroflexi bacterium]|nr:HD domain-containing protein [Chloroflexota bacterium]